MKIGQFFKKLVGGSMILAALACPVFNSCADYSTDIEGIKGELADLEDRVAALEEKLNNDLAALQTLLEGKINAVAGDLADLEGKVDGLVTVKECKQNANGEYELTLSDGTKFTVYPKYEQKYDGIVTTVTMDGTLYWAMFDANGTPKAMTDAAGNLIPVVDVVPQTKKGDDGFFYVSFDGGQTWETTGVSEPCVFAGAEVVYSTPADEYSQPEALYVVLTLADGNTITVSLDGVSNFMFGTNYGGPISSQFVAFGGTAAVSAQLYNIESWIKEVPAGWLVEENTQYIEYGQIEFNVTAPSAEAIASGAAVKAGDMKVLAVAPGGKTITATVYLTTEPFGKFEAGKGNLTVEMNNGVGGYLVGISTVADYNPEAIVTELKAVVEECIEEEDWWSGEMVQTYPWSPWYTDGNATTLDDNYMDMSLEDYPVASLNSQIELVEGEQYVIWAVALNSWYDPATYAQGYTVASIHSTTYFNGSIEIDEANTVVSFNDIQIKAEFKGVQAFYGYFASASYGAPTMDDIVSQINEGLSSPWGGLQLIPVEWENGIYEGDPNTLVYGWESIHPATKYYMWLAPAVEGKTTYTAADVYYYEWETDPLMAGGKLVPAAGEPTLDYKKISVPLTAEGAVYMYYKYVEPEMISTIEDKAAYLLENGTMSNGSSLTANIANLSPSVSRILLAMAVDQYGCYGDVFQQEFTTKAYEYAAAKVTAELQGKPSTKALIKVSADAEVDTYYYWYGESTSYQWTNEYYFGGTVESASAYFALSPNSYLFKKVTPANLPADGIELTNLTLGSDYVFVISAKLTDGTYTKATLVEFKPSMDLGNFVYATDDNGAANSVWEAAKPTVTVSTESLADFTMVSWSVDVPAGFTAKTACFHKDYLTDYPTAKDKVQFIMTYEYIDSFDVVAGESYVQPYASAGYNIYTVLCDAEGNYYETYVTELNISGGFGQ